MAHLYGKALRDAQLAAQIAFLEMSSAEALTKAVEARHDPLFSRERQREASKCIEAAQVLKAGGGYQHGQALLAKADATQDRVQRRGLKDRAALMDGLDHADFSLLRELLNEAVDSTDPAERRALLLQALDQLPKEPGR